MIQHTTLTQFLSIEKELGINLGDYTAKCGAYDFLEQESFFDMEIHEYVTRYIFKEVYHNLEELSYLQSFKVLYLINKAYLMYEDAGERILIWVCYTEENVRNAGHMTTLLQGLKNTYPSKPIIIDTYNDSLRKICGKLDIELFRNEIKGVSIT